MQFDKGYIYHVYNRGNNKQQIFFSDEDYLLFLHYAEKFITPVSDVISWCLMPHHFHFLIYVGQTAIEKRKCGGIEITNLSYGFKQMLSSYTKSINKRLSRTGNLFQQKTKSKCVNDTRGNYCRNAFLYIHQNPLRAKLVKDPEDWPYSSYTAFLGIREPGITNIGLARQYVDIDNSELKTRIHEFISDVEVQSVI